MVIEYFSPRGLADLAGGLIDACVAFYGRGIAVKREDLAPRRRRSRCELTRQQLMSDSDLERLKRRGTRERATRKQAETLLEAKSLELFESNQALAR